RPARVLRRQNVALGVRHQAKHAAAGIANAGHISLGAVRIHGVASRFAVGIDIAKDDLCTLFEALQNPGLTAAKISFTMGDWQVQPIIALKERTALAVSLQANPAILEPTQSVVGQGSQRTVIIRLQEQAGLEQDLEAVADAENKFVAVAELTQSVAEKV